MRLPSSLVGGTGTRQPAIQQLRLFYYFRISSCRAMNFRSGQLSAFSFQPPVLSGQR